MSNRRVASLGAVALVICLAAGTVASEQTGDPLPSWNDTPTKADIVAFVHDATDAKQATYVPPALRIATFDNDGTMWVEQPLYTQVVFALDRVRELAPQHPEWKTERPFATLLSSDRTAIDEFSIQDFTRVIAETHAGITIDEFQSIVRRWLDTARHPRFKQPYTKLVYQPMLELMQYLRANGFATYIVTGGGQEFVRVFADGTYGVPPENVVGSAGKTKYQYDASGRPELIMLPETILIDDGGGKPEGINLVIGRRPVAAFGNSTGDREMLEWTQAGAAPNGSSARLMMLVHHDDAQREYAYGANSKIGTFSEELMSEAHKRGWLVISMKRDWKRIFGLEQRVSGLPTSARVRSD
jgi:phosphoglycolate phosphatase-like HAD superfamily hydrolase